METHTLPISTAALNVSERDHARVLKVIDDAAEAIIITDSAHRVLSWNKQAEVMFGCQKYVEVMAATDMSDLPPDVRDAYARHIQAWRDMATVLDHYSGYTGAFLKGYDGEAGKAKYDAAGKVIDDTWKDVKAKAAAHGVDTSTYP